MESVQALCHLSKARICSLEHIVDEFRVILEEKERERVRINVKEAFK